MNSSKGKIKEAKGVSNEYKSPDFYRKDDTQYRLTELGELKNEYKIDEESELCEGNPLKIFKMESEENILNVVKNPLKSQRSSRFSLEVQSQNDGRIGSVRMVSSKGSSASNLNRFSNFEQISQNFGGMRQVEIEEEEEEDFSEKSNENQYQSELSHSKEGSRKTQNLQISEQTKENNCCDNNVYSSRSHYFSSQTFTKSQNNQIQKPQFLAENTFSRKSHYNSIADPSNFNSCNKENLKNSQNFLKRKFESRTPCNQPESEKYPHRGYYRSEFDLKNCEKLKENGFKIENIDNEKSINDELFKATKGLLNMCRTINSKIKNTRVKGFKDDLRVFRRIDGYSDARRGARLAKERLKGEYGVDIGGLSLKSSFRSDIGFN